MGLERKRTVESYIGTKIVQAEPEGCPKDMSKKTMREFASTKHEGLLDHMPARRKKG